MYVEPEKKIDHWIDKSFLLNTSFEVNPSTNSIKDVKTGGDHHLEPRLMQVLILLVSHAKELVTREQFITDIWANNWVGEEALTQAVSRLRKVFGDHPTKPAYIQTVPKKGYRLIAKVELDRSNIPPVSKDIQPQGSGLLRFNAVAILIGCLFVLLMANTFRKKERMSHTSSSLTQFSHLTSMPGLELQPSLSEDGQFLLYAKQINGRFQIFLKDLVTNQIAQISQLNGNNLHPFWLSDKQSLGFINVEKGQAKVYLKAVEAISPQPLFDLPISNGVNLDYSADQNKILYAHPVDTNKYAAFEFHLETEGAKPIFSLQQEIFSIRYSPDGSTIAYVSGLDDGCKQAIYLFDTKQQLHHLLSDPLDKIFDLDWLDESTLLITAIVQKVNGIYRLDLRTGSLHLIKEGNIEELQWNNRIKAIIANAYEIDKNIWRKNIRAEEDTVFLNPITYEMHPSISPDGKSLAYVSDESGYFEVWLADAQSLNRKKLTNFEAVDIGNPSWHPNSSSLVVSVMDTKGKNLYRVSINNGHYEKLTNDHFDNHFPSYSDGGTAIYFFSNRSGRNELWHLELRSKKIQQLTTEGADYGVVFQGNAFYNQLDSEGIWKQQLSTGKRQQIEIDLSKAGKFNWQLLPQGLFYLADKDQSLQINCLPLDGGEPQVYLIKPSSLNHYKFEFSVSLANQAIYYTRRDYIESSVIQIKL